MNTVQGFELGLGTGLVLAAAVFIGARWARWRGHL